MPKQLGEILWQPGAERVAASALTRFAAAHAPVAGQAEPEAAAAALWRWSVAQPGAFWRGVWDFCEVIGHPGERAQLTAGRFHERRFFPDARLNFAENLLRDGGDAVVLSAWLEDGSRRAFSGADLQAAVASLATALRRVGVAPGDRVAGYLPNIPEAVIGMLASASLGAVWTSCSPDFGAQAVLDRFGQVQPRVLLACNGYLYGGRRLDVTDRIGALLEGVPTIEQCVVVPLLEELGMPPGSCSWADFTAGPSEPLAFAALPFDHPLYILYSSGTTGTPKCIVHGAGGSLLQHLKEHRLHVDLGSDDVLFYFTTCGWMMWNWLVSGLASGARLVLYDGSPLHPDADVLWRMADAEGVTVFGTSARYLAACAQAGVMPAPSDRLRTLLSTGSPLLPDQFDWLTEALGEAVQIASISGGTDIVSCFALGHPWLPVRRGEISARGLGMAVDVFDDSGAPLRGGAGELVCTAPFPSMPVGFWNDPDDARYYAAYFERFDDVWCHGDWAELTDHEGLVIHGRSDAVLNPGGVRIGTAEIYRQVDPLPEIAESLAIGQAWQGDVRVVLFVVTAPGVSLDDGLRERIRVAIRAGASPRHVPARILEVPDLPRTRSGKISELAVRDLVHGRELGNRDALANPEALEAFRDRPELAS